MFEYAVRPFQSRDSFGRAILPATPSSGTAEKATLTWGNSASLPPAALPKPTTMGVNVQCCQEIRTQDGAEMPPAVVGVEGPHPLFFEVRRSTVVLAKKQDKNTCNDWLMNNSYVASGVSTAFNELSSLIHASDDAFRPAGSGTECRETTNYAYGVPG